MNPKIVNLAPKRYLCPYCGNWHEFYGRKITALKDYSSKENSLLGDSCDKFFTAIERMTFTWFYLENEKLYFNTNFLCSRVNKKIEGAIPIYLIKESSTLPIVTFEFELNSENRIGEDSCFRCISNDYCNFCKSATGDGKISKIKFGFEFDPLEYFAIVNGDNVMTENEKNILKNKENSIMVEKKKNNTTIKEMLYERSPKENMQMLKDWSEKYKPTLRWAIPVVAVYGAYRILNSNEFDISVNNIADACEKKLGFKLELLEDKKALKELMVLGGFSATAYGTLKAVSAIFGKTENADDISIEEVESGMNQVETISKKFAWIQPKMEALMPIAFSVITVYLILHKPKFDGKIAKKVQNLTEDWQIRIGAYLDLAKLFIQDKFKMDLSNEEEKKKAKIIAILAIMIAIFAILYGKKVLSKDEAEQEEDTENKAVETFVEQAREIIKKIAPSVYTTIVTLLISNKILATEEIPEIEDKKGEKTDDKIKEEVMEESSETDDSVVAE